VTDFAVRLARVEDEAAIFGLCKELHDENGLFDMDEDSVWQIIKSATNQGGGIIGVIDGEDGLEGIICIVIDKFWYSKEFFLCELFNFVPVRFRKSERAKSLIEFAKKCSDSMKMPLVIGVISNIRTEAKVKLYERRLPKAGAFFVYNREYARIDEHVR
jgi:hypothetical protein